MGKIHVLIKLAYEKSYDSKLKKQYSEPAIEDFGGDLAKKWYVYFSFRNPDSGKLVRQTPIYTGLHMHKTKKDRMAAAIVLRNTLSRILKDGLYNPFTDDDLPIDEARKLTVREALGFVLAVKKNEYTTGYADFKSRITRFVEYLEKNGFRDRFITRVNRIVVINYLNTVSEKTSGRNRNNTRTAISTFYTVLVDNFIVPTNFIDEIKKVKSKPERNKSFTAKQEKEILDMLLETETGRRVWLYVKFVSWGLLRPIEVNRLTIEDIDRQDRTMSLKAKNQAVKIKRVPDVLLEELPSLVHCGKKDFLFGRDALGQPWDANEVSRRDYYSELFRDLVKVPFGLGKEYGYYSFRHTYIARVLTNLLKQYSYYEAESKAMLITGHTSTKAFRMYLREIDAQLPDDFSHLIK